jgi:hypothetical protein
VPVGGRQAIGRVAKMREWVGFFLQEEVAESSPRLVEKKFQLNRKGCQRGMEKSSKESLCKMVTQH